MKRNILSIKWVQVLLHILVWGAIFALPYLTELGHHPRRPMMTAQEQAEFFQLNIYSYFFWVGIFYLNSYFLIPRFFNRKKYGWYILSVIAAFCLVLAIHALLFMSIVTAVPFILVNSIRFNLPAFLLVLIASYAFRMTLEKIRSDQLQLQKEQEHMKSELSFLRWQTSPHFILNVLNNIVALNRLKSEELEPTLMKLSGLMQYMLYESDAERVFVKTEAEYLQCYIDLQKQRFGDKINISFRTDLANEWSEIEPMLMIPFVENAFKHGTGAAGDHRIDIVLRSNEQDELFFSVRNNYIAPSGETKDKTPGIGIANVQRRLDILYGKNHSLDIRKEKDKFEVKLAIKLHT